MGTDFTAELKSLGHRVEVLTGFPNYPEGRLYEGHRLAPVKREVIGGTPVTRVVLYPSHDHSAWRRILNYATFASTATVLGIPTTRRPDVILAYHPPGTIGPTAVALSHFHGAPLVYHIQDLWPDSLASSRMFTSRLGLGVIGNMMKFVYGQSAAIIVISNGFKRTLVERGVPEKKVHVVHNWASDSIGCRASQRSGATPTKGTFDIVYAGNMGAAQGLASVLDAAAILESTAPAIRFVFIGEGLEKAALRQTAHKRRMRNVTFRAQMPPAAIGETLSAADALLVHLRDDALFHITIPSKVQAYLAAGRPILAGVLGDASRLIDRAGAGIACLPENPQSIAEAAVRLQQLDPSTRRQMGLAGRSYFERHLTMKAGVASIEDILVSAARSAAGGAR